MMNKQSRWVLFLVLLWSGFLTAKVEETEGLPAQSPSNNVPESKAEDGTSSSAEAAFQKSSEPEMAEEIEEDESEEEEDETPDLMDEGPAKSIEVQAKESQPRIEIIEKPSEVKVTVEPMVRQSEQPAAVKGLSPQVMDVSVPTKASVQIVSVEAPPAAKVAEVSVAQKNEVNPLPVPSVSQAAPVSAPLVTSGESLPVAKAVEMAAPQNTPQATAPQMPVINQALPVSAPVVPSIERVPQASEVSAGTQMAPLGQPVKQADLVSVSTVPNTERVTTVPEVPGTQQSGQVHPVSEVSQSTQENESGADDSDTTQSAVPEESLDEKNDTQEGLEVTNSSEENDAGDELAPVSVSDQGGEESDDELSENNSQESESDSVSVDNVSDVDINRKSEECKKLVLNAIQHVQKVSLAQACNDFIHNNIWRKGELFVFVYSEEGTCLAYGDDHWLMWQSIKNVKGIAGDPLVNDMLSVGKKGGRLSFLWNNGYQTAYVQTVIKDSKKYIIGCGFYPENDEYATKQLVKTAAAYFYKDGRDATFALISNPTGPFVKGDIYMFVYDFNGINVAHGQNAALVGQNLIDLQDSRGKSLIKELISVARTKGRGWVDYYWRNEFKRSYVEKVVDPKTKVEYLIAAGYYPHVTLDSVKSYVNRAVAFLKTNGAAKAIPEFSNLVGEFALGGLGIFVFNYEGKCLANGVNPSYVGQNLMKITGTSGRFYVRDMIRLAREQGSALVTYTVFNANAVAYVQNVETPDGKFIVGAEFFPLSKFASTQTLVNRAVELLLASEPDVAFGKLSDRDTEYLRGDLSVFVYDEDGTRLVNGVHKSEVWKNLLKTTDQQGKMVVSDLISVAINGGGWLEYHTRNATRKVYVKAVPKKRDGNKIRNYIVGSGYFL